MTTGYDVPAKELIDELAKKLQKEDAIKKPEGSTFLRTAVHKEKPPENPDWWYIRCASILRKIYINDTIGIQHLRFEYSGNKNRGSKPNKALAGSGSIIRKSVQQLEKAGFVTKVKGKGRMITAKGRSFVDNIANDVKKNISSEYPDLAKY